MKSPLVSLALVLLLVVPAAAQQPGRSGKPAKPAAPAPAPSGKPTPWKSEVFQVEATFPAGWAKKYDEPKTAGAWVNLVDFTEPRSGAEAVISYQATTYRTSDQMFTALRREFQNDASLGILRIETRTATSNRPEGITIEYTFQGKDGPQHAVSAYWLFLGRRYRVYATAREAAWRTIGSDVESIVSSVALTGRAFSENPQNYRDEPGNFEIWFPDGFRIRIPATGPRVVFQSDRLGVGLWIYMSDQRTGDLAAAAERLVKTLKDDGADVTKETRPETHPALGVDAVTIEYTKKQGGNTYRYRETVILHREKLYRFVLAAADSVFASGEDVYTRFVRSISFLR